ncbi:MAG: Na+/H+ antiporter subunit B [Polyangiaceae bacterium]
MTRYPRPEGTRAGMSSLVLRSAIRYLLPLLLLFSVFLFLRGHDEPGGGFAGGLVAAAAFALHGLALGREKARRSLPVSPGALIGGGLSLAVGSGLVGPLSGRPFLTPVWVRGEVPILGSFGTPVVFDLGVYLTVIGVVLLMVVSLLEG